MNKVQNILTSISIVLGFGLVAIAIFLQGSNIPALAALSKELRGHEVATATSPSREVNRTIYGNPDAPVTIVEWSDFECPYCMRLHTTLKKIVDESGGKISWEYRHLPLPNHTSAGYAAGTSECLRTMVSNDVFWQYADSIFFGDGTRGVEHYRSLGSEFGLSEQAIDDCVYSDEVREQIEADIQVAQDFGGSGTPFSVIEFADGTTKPVSGALPYEHWASVLNL